MFPPLLSDDRRIPLICWAFGIFLGGGALRSSISRISRSFIATKFGTYHWVRSNLLWYLSTARMFVDDAEPHIRSNRPDYGFADLGPEPGIQR